MAHVLVMLCFLFLLTLFKYTVKAYNFALVPKTTDNPFFQLAHSGCVDHAALWNDTCFYGGVAATEENPNPDPDGLLQVEYVKELLLSQAVDGLAISVKNSAEMTPVINQAVRAGITVVTFDSDASDSNRTTYVGTDNYFLGKTLAKTAKQIAPQGGSYAVVLSDTSPNVRDRDEGFRDEMDRNMELWTEFADSPVVYDRDLNKALEYMESFAKRNPSVLMTAVGGPLFTDEYADFYKRHRHRNITIVSADDFQVQINHLSRGFVQGLVGQMPYEMGFLAAKVLRDLKRGVYEGPEILGTNLVTHIQVPLVLPELQVNDNLIGDLAIIGYILFGLISATAICCGFWVYYCRKKTVVKAAQPIFLILVALGAIILGATILPLSVDDGGEPISDETGTLICMSIPWLACCGFTITFSALFSKTIRINRIVEETRECHRVKVSATDVLLPFAVLLTLNVILLLLWSFLDPLTYVRIDNPGTDGWNRVISTYGACRSDNPWYYLAPLAVINLSVLVMANWQAYKSRKIVSEFAETKYIAISMASLLQTFLIGIPILFVVRDSPQAFYLTIIFMIFVICTVVLLLIFVPKMVLAGEYSHRSAAEQQRMILSRIQESARKSQRSSGSKISSSGFMTATDPGGSGGTAVALPFAENEGVPTRESNVSAEVEKDENDRTQ